MSHSPTEPGPATDKYTSAWIAVNKLMRRGYSWSGRERNCAFLNVGDGTFARIDAVSGFGFYDDGRGASRIDWDLDGDLDLFLTNRNGPRVRLLRNDLPHPERFVAFRLEGVTCNRDAIGARVVVHLSDGTSLSRTLRAGEGYLAQSSSWVHFGIGPDRDIERVVVRWPGRDPEEYREIDVGRRYRLVQSSAVAEPWDPPRKESRLEPSGLVPPPASGRSRVILPVPLPMPRLTVESPHGEISTMFGLRPGRRPTPTGAPLLLSLWASWCPPCHEELAELSEGAARIRRAGLAVVALGTESGAERESAEKTLRELEWPHRVLYATPEAADVLDVLQGLLLDRDTRIALPASFLFDDQGRLLAMYFGRAELDTVLADLRLLNATPQERLEAASPFSGAWGRIPEQIDFVLLRNRYASRGLEATAREIQLANTEFVQSSRAVLLYDFGMRAEREGRFEDAIGYLLEATREDPKFASAWGALGIALHRGGQVERAIDAYGQALLLNPDDHATRFNLGFSHTVLGNRELAENQLKLLREAGRPEADLLERAIARMDDDEH